MGFPLGGIQRIDTKEIRSGLLYMSNLFLLQSDLLLTKKAGLFSEGRGSGKGYLGRTVSVLKDSLKSTTTMA